MKTIHKRTIFIGAGIATLILIAVLIAVSVNKKASVYENAKIEKEGDFRLLSDDHIARDKLIVGASGVVGLPYLATTDGDDIACKLIYESLITFDTDGRIQYAIADSLVINESGDEYTLYINKDSRFSDGTPVSADDIKCSYQLMSDSSVEGKYNAGLSYIKGYYEFRNGSSSGIDGIVTGDGFVTFKFAKVRWSNIYALNLPITNAASLDYKKGTARTVITESAFSMLGTSAYALEDTNGEGIVLRRVEEQANSLSQIVITPVGASSVANLFKAGVLDIYTFENDAKFLAEAEEIQEASLLSYASSNIPYVGINCRDGALSNVNVRKAISLAIQGQKDKARRQITMAGYELYDPQNTDGSSDYLDFTIITYNAESFTVDCDYIVKQLEAAGVRAKTAALGLQELREQIKGENFDLYYTKVEVDKHGSVYFANNEIEGLLDDNIEQQKINLENQADYAKYNTIYLSLIKAYEDRITRIALDGTKKYILYSPRLANITPNPYNNTFLNEVQKRLP